MDVGEWLKGVGLGQYEASFRAHDIDVDVLPDVTEADLEKIGLPLGARKRLMKAIANLRPAEFYAIYAACGNIAADRTPFAAPASRRRTPSDHGHVLRSRRLDEHSCEARPGGLAKPGQRLSR